MEYKNTKYYETAEEECRTTMWRLQYEQRHIIEELERNIKFQFQWELYYLIVNGNLTSEFNYEIFTKFITRASDAPYERYMGQLTSNTGAANTGIGRFIKACLATETETGIAPIAKKLLIDDGYRQIVEDSNSLTATLGFINGFAQFAENFMQITDQDTARFRRVLLYRPWHDLQKFTEEYNKC